MILIRILVLFSMTCWASFYIRRSRSGSEGAYLVLGSVRWWVRGRVEFEVRVEELQGGQGHGLYKRHVAHLLRDKAIQRSHLRENAHLTNG